MVILNTLPPDLKAYVEDPFENTTGLDLSSLLARMRQLLFPDILQSSLPIVLSNSGSLSSSSFSKIDTPLEDLWHHVTPSKRSIR